jgi:hypothetical protein
LVVPTEADLGEFIGREIHLIAERYRKEWGKAQHPKTSGILFHIATPAFVQEYGLFTAVQRSSIYHIHGKSDAALLEELAKTVKM